MGIIEKYICIFFVYSIAGWCMETFRGYFKTGKLVNRGFLIGPYCPVYGIGVSLITVFLNKYVNDIPILFGMSIIICGLLEYFTSWIMEKVFKARWWDYHNRKFNINGRICLETLLPFGILGTILLKFVNPLIFEILGKIPNSILIVILRILVFIFIIDVVISFKVINNFKKSAKLVENETVKDNTEEISKKVKEVTTEEVKELIDNAEVKINEAKEDLEYLNRKINVKLKLVKRNVKFTGKKMYLNWKEIDLDRKANIENLKIEIRKKLKSINNQEYTLKVKEKFLSRKSLLNKRLTEAFPDLQFKLKNRKSKKGQ